MDDSKKKIEAYFLLISKHIIAPVEEGILNKSCYATVILLFSAIDSLGKLTHLNEKAAVGTRFKYFVSTLGKEYEENKDQLWILRNSLIHNGLNHISYLASTVFGKDEHLKIHNPNNMIYINTMKFYSDFMTRYESLKQEILNNDSEIIRVGARLEWAVGDTDIYLYTHLTYTHPGTVSFISLR